MRLCWPPLQLPWEDALGSGKEHWDLEMPFPEEGLGAEWESRACLGSPTFSSFHVGGRCCRPHCPHSASPPYLHGSLGCIKWGQQVYVNPDAHKHAVWQFSGNTCFWLFQCLGVPEVLCRNWGRIPREFVDKAQLFCSGGIVRPSGTVEERRPHASVYSA